MDIRKRRAALRALTRLWGEWQAVDSRPRSRRDKVRKWSADALQRLAYRIDPMRPMVTAGPNGSHVVSTGGVDLARIEPGMIRDTRPVRASGAR